MKNITRDRIGARLASTLVSFALALVALTSIDWFLSVWADSALPTRRSALGVLPPAWTLTGQGNESLGSALATAGDVNNDGYDDFLVSSDVLNNGRGRVAVFMGQHEGMSVSPAVTLAGENVGDQFGGASASAGDVNNDSYNDVIVGAWVWNNFQGRAYVYLGGPTGLRTTPAITLTGYGGGFGSSAAGAGDVNGDGFSDVIVGAYTCGGSYGGCAYVYMGNADGVANTPAVTLTGTIPLAYFGASVASAGDTNNDGYADIIVGAGGSPMVSGYARVYYGAGAGISTSSGVTLTSDVAGYRYGYGVRGVGDINGDGYADVAIGTASEPGFAGDGRVNVYFGSAAGISPTPDVTISGGSTEGLGVQIAPLGNVNGDVYDDLLVGTRRERAYVFLGAADGLSPVVTPIRGGNAGDRYASTLGYAGDVNADGYGDALIGAYYYPAMEAQGRAYLYLGGLLHEVFIPNLHK